MQAPFFMFCHLHKLCKRHFLRFVICIGYASIKTLVFTFAERRCVFGMVGAGLCARPNVRAAAFPYQKTHVLCAGNLTMDAPLQGDTGGHIGAAPTHLHQTTRCAPTALHCTFDSPRQSHGVFTPHRIAHSIAPNRTVCPYPIGVILSIAQGWQVQRSLPWVMMRARRLPHWGLYFFSSHIITTRGE